MSPLLMTIKQAANESGYPVSTIEHAVRLGELATTPIPTSQTRKITQANLKKWLSNKGQKSCGKSDRCCESGKRVKSPAQSIRTKRKPMTPARKELVEITYSIKCAVRLRELREKKSLTVPEMVERLSKEDFTISVSNYYKWENGAGAIPLDAIPAIASIFGFKSPGSFFPK